MNFLNSDLLPLDINYLICSYLSQFDVYNRLIYVSKFWYQLIIESIKHGTYIAGSLFINKILIHKIYLPHTSILYVNECSSTISLSSYTHSLKTIKLRSMNQITFDFFIYPYSHLLITIVLINVIVSDTPIIFPENLENLSLCQLHKSVNYFSSLKYPKSLKSLNIEEDKKIIGEYKFPNVKELNLVINDIDSSNYPLPSFLTTLSITGQKNVISLAIPLTLSTQLTSLNFNACEFLPLIPESVKVLSISNMKNCLLSNLPKSLIALKIECCSLKLLFHQLTGFTVNLPDGLKKLKFLNSNLCKLPVLPASLTELNVENNHLTELPILPSQLTNFNCSNNINLKLSGVKLPPTLTKLVVSKAYDMLSINFSKKLNIEFIELPKYRGTSLLDNPIINDINSFFVEKYRLFDKMEFKSID